MHLEKNETIIANQTEISNNERTCDEIAAAVTYPEQSPLQSVTVASSI